MKQFEAWAGFKGRLWKEEVNTRDFIQNKGRRTGYGYRYRFQHHIPWPGIPG